MRITIFLKSGIRREWYNLTSLRIWKNLENLYFTYGSDDFSGEQNVPNNLIDRIEIS